MIHSGTQLGPYELGDQIGVGGMGQVYRARDTRLGREVAIKIIADSFLEGIGTPGTTSRDRFQREARSASSLNHPNICTIHDIGEQDGRPYLVMELLRGETLKHYLRRGPVPIAEVLKFALEATSALEAAHDKGIMHRDIKPANLFVVTDAHGQRHLKILDFGLAKHHGDAPLDDSGTGSATGTLPPAALELTSPGSTVGTIAYMSPEQAKGEPLDARTDLFSLGAVIYETATGVAPFTGGSAPEIFVSLLTKEPQKPSSLRPQLPTGFDGIVLRLLAKDRVQRYASADDLHGDLERMARGEAISRREKTRPEAPIASKSLRYGLVGVLALVIVAAGAFWWIRHRSTSAETRGGPQVLTAKDSIILSDFTNNTGDPVFDTTLKQALAIQLEQSPFLNIVSDQHLRQSLTYLGKSPDERVTLPIAREIGEREGMKALLTGSIASLGSSYVIALEAVNTATGDTFAREQVEAGRKEDVLAALDKAATVMRARLGESLATIQKLDTPFGQATTPSLEAFRTFALGEIEHEKGNDIPQAAGYYKQAVELDPNFAMAYARLGTIYFGVGAFRQSATFTSKAFELSKNVSERERLYISSRYYGDVLGDVNKTIEALNLYFQLYPREGVAANNLCVEYLLTGQFEQSLVFARRAIELDPNRASSYINTMDALIGLGRSKEAIELYKQSKARLVTENTNLVETYMLAAFLVGDKGSIEAGLAAVRGRPDEFQLVQGAAWLQEADGHMSKADEKWRLAQSLVHDQKLPDAEGPLYAYQAYDHALLDDCAMVRPTVKRALALDHERLTNFLAVSAVSFCGDPSGANALVEELRKDFPQDTLVTNILIPVMIATADLNRNQPEQALTALRGHEAYDLCSPAPYLRGLAELRLNRPQQAIADFQIVTSHRDAFIGGALISQYASITLAYPLSELGLARAYSMAGDKAAATRAYQTFLTNWKDADSDLKPLQEAKQELAAL